MISVPNNPSNMKNVMVAKIDHDKLIVTQANKLVEASYSMTLEEKRLTMLMLSLIRQDDKEFQIYRLPIIDIGEYLCLSTHKLYENIRRIAKTLRSRGVSIPKEGGGWLETGWVSSAKYVPKGTNGAEVACIDLRCDPEMMPYLLELKAQFSSYMLMNVAGLRSFYSIRMYELLNSRRRLITYRVDIDELKRLLQIETKYPSYKDVRTRVLLPAQRELLEKTDLSFEFEDGAIRGRKVTSVLFHIKDNKPTKMMRTIAIKPSVVKNDMDGAVDINDRQPQLLPLTESEKEGVKLYHETIKEGLNNGITDRVIRDLLSTRNPAHVMENIELARKRHMSAKGDNVNLAGLTVSAITDDYAAPDREKRTAAAAKKTDAQRKKAAAEMIDRIHDAVQRQRRTETARIDQEHGIGSAVRAEFENELAGGSLAGMFAARGWKMPGISPLWHGFLARRFLPSETEQRRAYAATLGQDYDELCQLAPPK